MHGCASDLVLRFRMGPKAYFQTMQLNSNKMYTNISQFQTILVKTVMVSNMQLNSNKMYTNISQFQTILELLWYQIRRINRVLNTDMSKQTNRRRETRQNVISRQDLYCLQLIKRFLDTSAIKQSCSNFRTSV